MRRFNRKLFSSSSDECHSGGRWWGVGLGAGVGGEAGADGSRFAGKGVVVFLLVLRDRPGLLVKLETELRFDWECESSWSNMVEPVDSPMSKSWVSITSSFNSLIQFTKMSATQMMVGIEWNSGGVVWYEEEDRGGLEMTEGKGEENHRTVRFKEEGGDSPNISKKESLVFF